MAFQGVRILLAAVVVCLLVAAPCANAAITCSRVATLLSACVSYLRGRSGPIHPPPPPFCCTGLRSLNSLAKTKAERQAACNCLTQLFRGVNLGRARTLPASCGVRIPYPISPTISCST
ncbi:unnamed protein product [Spirodela intermedia]|uniref:Non-specific lipid-transfer protein n=1 Tax=Spirodela intermedia TaxID=51605 RepID=A0A7I8LA92_SPIIN|nr:unnamed protein product [Spirodela intermedia]